MSKTKTPARARTAKVAADVVSSPAPVAPPAPPPQDPAMPDFEKLSRNVARFVEEGGKALAAVMKPMETGKAPSVAGPSPEFTDMFVTLGRVAEFYMTDGRRAMEAQSALSSKFLELWGSTYKKLSGDPAGDVVTPDAGDKRFTDPDWKANPYYDFIKQAYVLTSRWADDLVTRADDLDPHTRDKAAFYLKQVTSALSPSNFLVTNPELVRSTMAESGENLVRGMKMMAEDIQAGNGQLRIRQADAAKFKLGVNLAATPGKVVFRNELIELHPICALHPDRAQAAVADRAAVDQQVLRARPQPGKILHPLGGGAGADRVRRLLGQPRRAPRRQGLRSLHARGHFRLAGGGRGGDGRARRRHDRLLRRRHACSPSRSPSWPS